MNRLSIGTISALFLAGAIAPAAFANVSEGLRSQNQTVSQLPGQPQTPAQTPGSGQTLPGQTRGQGPGQFPPNQNQAPGQMGTPGQMRTPGQTSMPSTDFNSMGRGESLATDLVSPFQLAYMATGGNLYQGGEGYSAYRARHGNAEGRNIVEAAINQGYISSALMEDQGYINSVNQILRMQASDWRN